MKEFKSLKNSLNNNKLEYKKISNKLLNLEKTQIANMISIKLQTNKINLNILKNNYQYYNNKKNHYKKLDRLKIKLSKIIKINKLYKKYKEWNNNLNN